MDSITTNKAKLYIGGKEVETEVVTVRKLNDKGGYDVEVHIPHVQLTAVKES